jgi:hypothetical protein
LKDGVGSDIVGATGAADLGAGGVGAAAGDVRRGAVSIPIDDPVSLSSSSSGSAGVAVGAKMPGESKLTKGPVGVPG